VSIASEASESIEVVEPELPAYARTAGDVVRVVGSSAALLAALLVAAIFRASINGAETDVVKLAGTVPGPLTQVLRFASGYFGFIGAVALIVALVIIQRLRVAVMVTAAAAAGAIAMFAISKALASDVALPGDLGQLRGVAYIGSQFLAGATAVLTVISPWIERPWRRAGAILIALTAFTRITTVLQTATSESPYDVAVAILLGWLVGALILLIFGSPNRRPSGLHIGESLRRSGLDVVKLEHAGVGVRGSTIYRALERDGTARFVKVFSADQPDADRLVQAWRWFRLRDAALEQPFASLRRSVEHEAFLSLYAFDGNIPTARLATIAEVEPGGMLLAFDYVDGNSLQGNGPDHLTDPILRGIWQEVARLHSLNVAHRDLRLAHVLLDPEGAPVLVDFGYAEVAASDLQIRTDVAELLCSTAVEVGAERAVAAAIDVLGSDAIGRALPRLQPLALRPATRKAMAACDGLLGELQEQVQTATGIEDVKYEELARVSPKTVVGFAVFAIALYALLPRLAEVSDIGATLATAVWVWIIPLLMFQSVTYVGAGLGIEGSVPDRVAFFPTMKAQVAAAFVDVLAPASIGGMALNTRFLQKRGVDPGVAVAGVGLNVVAGVVAHVLLLAGLSCGSAPARRATARPSAMSARSRSSPCGCCSRWPSWSASGSPSPPVGAWSSARYFPSCTRPGSASSSWLASRASWWPCSVVRRW
jgi:tRNA A-37 threonylcarbamoyl transferase component Bud32